MIAIIVLFVLLWVFKIELLSLVESWWLLLGAVTSRTKPASPLLLLWDVTSCYLSAELSEVDKHGRPEQTCDMPVTLHPLDVILRVSPFPLRPR